MYFWLAAEYVVGTSDTSLIVRLSGVVVMLASLKTSITMPLSPLVMADAAFSIKATVMFGDVNVAI